MIGGETVCNQRLVEEDAADLHVPTQSERRIFTAAKKQVREKAKANDARELLLKLHQRA